MSLGRILAIIRKDFTGGLGRTFFILAVVVPVLMTLVINLIFGRLFAEKPTLAVVDEGHSEIGAKIKRLDSVIIEEVEDEQDLREKVKNGAIDGGLILPKYFDEDLDKNKLPEVEINIGGESLASNRMVLASSLAELVRKEAGQKVPVDIIETSLGKEAELPIKVRVIPLLVLYAIFIGGCTLPAAMIVDEVQKRTISAVTITPATLGELLSAKAIVGFLTSFVMGIVILVMNQVFTGNVWLLLIFMLLAAIFAVEIGLTIGQFSKDMTTAWTYVKLIGFLVFIPALLFFFPQVPEWVSKLFPTYYLFNPIIEITRHAAEFADVWLDALILLGFDIFFVVFVLLGKRRMALRT
jgi:ABC-2 type transport system permease protein